MSCCPPAGGLSPGLTCLWVLLWMSPSHGLASLQIPLGQCHMGSTLGNGCVWGWGLLDNGPVEVTPGLYCSPLKPAGLMVQLIGSRSEHCAQL